MAALDHPEGRVEDVIPIAGAAKLRAVIDEHRAKGTLDARIQQTMRNSYASHYRRMLPPLLQALRFRSNNAMWHPILTALNAIARFAETRPVVSEGDVPEAIILKWRNTVIDENGRVNVVLELCALTQLRERIRAKEIWLEGANRYRNPDDDLPGTLPRVETPMPTWGCHVTRRACQRREGGPGTGASPVECNLA